MGDSVPVTETRGGDQPGDIEVDPDAVRHAELLWLALEEKETPGG